MMRSTMPYWIQECPTCGYGAGSIDKAKPGAEEAMAGENFKTLLSSTLKQTLPGRFLKAVVRTVTENARTLKFKEHSGFEEE